MKKILLSTLIGSVILISAYGIRLLYPAHFSPTVFTIEKGMTVNEIAARLEEQSVVRSAGLLKVALRLTGDHETIVPGDYSFKYSQTAFGVAWRIGSGDFKQEQRKATIPEGSTNEQIADIIKESYPTFDRDLFLNKVANDQGYLFPDTYFFASTSTDEAIAIMKGHFDTETKGLKEEAEKEGYDWNNVIIMASILEEEANNATDFAIVSGILWKRLEIGMALQVDAAPVTYEERGFPKTPLSNPGLAAIDAALHPQASDYLFYITGTDGSMYYAEDFDAHRANIEMYLK